MSMGEAFQCSEFDVEDPHEVTALVVLDFEDDEVTERIEVSASSSNESANSRMSFMPSLFRAL